MRHAFQHPRVAGRRLGQPQPRVAVEAGGFDDFGFEQVAGLVPRLEGARGVVGEAGASPVKSPSKSYWRVLWAWALWPKSA